MVAGIRWAALEDDAVDFADRLRALIERDGFAFLGTIRRDGSPRISPVEVHLVGPELMVVMIPNTHKARDVVRDPRVVLQSPLTNAADPGTEFKLSGRATIVVDESQRVATAQHIQDASGWRPRPSWLFLSLAIHDVAILDWDKDEMVLTRWDVSSGVRGPERRRLNLDAGTYEIA